LDVKLMKWFV